jgi:hypothetical protein
VPVEFIWTNRVIEPFYTYLPKYIGNTYPKPHDGTPPSENYALSRFNMYIGWDRIPTDEKDKNEADVLKSCTIFHDPDEKELLLSNSDWTSKSGKNQAQYEKFSKELLSVKDKNPLDLISPNLILQRHALTTAQFDLFHALAKNSGDKLTAITYPNSYTPDMLVSIIAIHNEHSKPESSLQREGHNKDAKTDISMSDVPYLFMVDRWRHGLSFKMQVFAYSRPDSIVARPMMMCC